MGNCLFHQQNLITIMKTDGKCIEYESPVKAYQVLSDFAGFALSETLPVSQYLRPETKLLCGHIYHLVPLHFTPPKSVKKKVRFLIPGEEAEHDSGVVRIKLVVTKQELQKMLKNGVFSADEMISQLQIEEHRGGADNTFRDDFDDRGWRPALESIPEGKLDDCNLN